MTTKIYVTCDGVDCKKFVDISFIGVPTNWSSDDFGNDFCHKCTKEQAELEESTATPEEMGLLVEAIKSDTVKKLSDKQLEKLANSEDREVRNKIKG